LQHKPVFGLKVVFCFDAIDVRMQVRIIDFDPVRFINFEADINYPVEEGIIQVMRALL
jgi:hypothetical protein